MLRLQITHPGSPTCKCYFDGNGAVYSRAFNLRLPNRRRFRVQSLLVENNTSFDPSHLSSTVGSSSFSVPHQPPLTTHRHIQVLTFTACLAAISATWLFCSAIPALLAFKRAAESLEKLMDVTREELPDTMAAVRLSGMEISDLTMELNDLGQEITQGVRKSTRAVRAAEERLRWLTNKAPIVSVQVAAPSETGTDRPDLARNVRSVREGIVKSRAFVQMFFTLTRYSRMLLSYFTSREKASR